MHRTVRHLAPLLIASFALTAGRANAAALTNSQIFSQFNSVIFGTFAASSEVEGRTVVGGNVTGGTNFQIRSGLANSAFGALSVYGSVTDTGTLNIDNGGSVAIAGGNSATYNMNAGGSAFVGGNNTGAITVTGGTANLSVIGGNSGALSLASGGSVYVGNGNTANITINGGATTLGINGNTSGGVSLNSGTTMSLNGSNTGTIQVNGGTLNYTGSPGTLTNINGGTTTKVGSLNLTAPTSTLGNFANTFQTQLTALSSQLNGVAANSTATSASGTLTLNAAPNGSGVAIFHVNSSQFSGASNVAISLNGATTAIINVNVDSCVVNVCTFSPSANFQSPTSYATAVLWNFVNATNLNFTTEIGGSILAPGAAVSNSVSIDGTLVAASDSSSSTGELHSYPYTGSFPGTSTQVPEPASLVLIGTGLLALACVSRRKRAAVRA